MASLVLCMAGLYRRFREAGYDRPKYLLDWQGGTILDRIIETMTTDGAYDILLLVANSRDLAHRDILGAHAAKANVAQHRIMFIEDTGGQAETAFISAQQLIAMGAGNDPVVFHNIDTILEGRDHQMLVRGLEFAEGHIDLMRAADPAYSYVALDAMKLVTEIAEKRVISNHATTGLYGFQSPEFYVEAFQAAKPSTEFYISDVYRALLDKSAFILGEYPPAGARTIILGTPAEYEAARTIEDEK